VCQDKEKLTFLFACQFNLRLLVQLLQNTDPKAVKNQRSAQMILFSKVKRDEGWS